MFNTSPIVEAARRLSAAYESGDPCAAVRDLIGADDVDAAYAVQDAMVRGWTDKGRRRVGCKIGLTSKAVQAQFGVDQPDYGMLFADMALADGEEASIDLLLQPRVEGEIAFRLGRDLDPSLPTLADLVAAIDYAVAAIEIVDSRIAGWDIRIADTIADNASSGLFVLGGEPRRLSDFDLRLCGAVLERNGEAVSFGAGAASLGNPLTATLWLARKMAEKGRPLRAGDVVMSGALGPMVPAEPGDAFELRINGVGSVRTRFAAAQKRRG